MKLLLIEDEKDLSGKIVSYLGREEYLIDKAYAYNEADEKINIYDYDCAVIDISLPGGSGLDLIRQLKISNPNTGIVIISAKNSLDDKLTGLDLGADDYLTKPFHLAELNSRIKSVLRRRIYNGTTTLTLNELSVEVERHEVFVDKKLVTLTKKEFEILIYLINNKGKVIAKEAIAEHIWGDDSASFDSLDFVYSHIKNIRNKLTDAGCTDYIKSVYGIGYKFALS